MKRYKYTIEGIVQGVGFRPYVYKLALKHQLYGFVLNNSNGVIIEIEGEEQNLFFFEEKLFTSPPPLSKITKSTKEIIYVKNETQFIIIQSDETDTKTTLVSPDIATCDECRDDIKNNPHYKNYFATNCTNCGPRYSIIKTVPYDRCNTSMGEFIMCEDCKEEYKNPLSRRYHAQPIACEKCGPQLQLIEAKTQKKVATNNPIKDMAQLIKKGHIVAIKGIGGFHLICDSTNDSVIQKLRAYKNRPSKPFALMCKNLEQVKNFAFINKKEKELLTSKEAPIVILDIKKEFSLSTFIAPNISKIGCMLAYSPLHIMLFESLDNPIIATSANLGDEPIITTSQKIIEKLPFVEFILDFDRDIVNAVDDSLVQVVDDKIQILRLARGYAPKVIPLKQKLKNKLLSVGANQKSTITIGFEDKLIFSPHIGDLGSKKSFDYFLRSIETFQRFYNFTPDSIICDLHPNYESTKWAKQQKIPLQEVQHHLSHIYSVMAEHNLQGDFVGFSFDGTGLGSDGELWGGEIFVGNKRKYHFKTIKLLGGEKAIKEPRRVALSLLFEKYTLEEILSFDLECINSFSKIELTMLHQAYTKNLNTPLTSSVGRLFDAIASFSNLCQFQSYEGEAGLLCESIYNKNILDTYTYCINNRVIEIDFDFFDSNIATKFINTLVKIILNISKLEQKEVILSGGVFQNKRLLNLVMQNLKKEKINFYYNQTTPCNDGGVSLGQLYYSNFKHKL
jgi:hydrogenase maturation protein HypF